MTFSKKERIELVFEIAEILERDYTTERANIILNTYGFASCDLTYNDPSISTILNAGSNTELREIAEHFDLVTPKSTKPSYSQRASSASPLLLFASHLNSHKKFVHQVRVELEKFGINLFVAHDSIEVDANWHVEIENALDRVDAGLVFLHEGFNASHWCDQEVGWLLGRHIPVMALNFGQTPYGPLGKHQAQYARDKDAESLTNELIERLSAKEQLVSSLSESLIKAISDSPNFATTDKIWRHLRKTTALDSAQCANLLAACEKNNQIHWACSPSDNGETYPKVILRFLKKQAGYSAIKTNAEEYAQLIQKQLE